MILFWILAAALTVVVVIALLRPLIRPPAPALNRERYDLEVYRDQLTEIDRDLARGVIAAAQAEAARAEVSRRILTAAESLSAPAAPITTSPRLALSLLVALPVGALTVYLAVGRPDLPDQPQAGRPASADQTEASPEVLSAVARLAERLKTEPNNLQGWVLLAQSLGKLGRLSDAATAWHQATELAPTDDELKGNLAEALTAANQDLVPEEARQLFEALLAKRPSEPRAAHYLALARAQVGDFKGALDRWVALAAVSPANAPWLPLIHERITDMAQRLNLDPTAVMPKPLPAVAASTPSPNQPADDQTTLIRSMVDKLVVTQEANPADVNGWLRLGRAYQMLGDGAKELEALKRGLTQAPANAELLVGYASALLTQHPPAETEPLPAEVTQSLHAALETAPDNQTALWYLGLDAANRGHSSEARTLWQRLLSTLEPSSTESAEIKARLAALK